MRVLLGSSDMPRGRFAVRWLFEPRDLWLGVFWNVTRARVGSEGVATFLLVYVCVVPLLPVAFVWRRR